MNRQTENRYLDFFKKQLESKLSWGSCADWSNEEYVTVCQQILESTGVSLSHTTLKRICGRVRYENSPSMTTLNALALFVGFENWRQLRNKVDNGKQPASGLKVNRKALWIGAAVVVFAVVLSFTIIKSNNIPADIGNNVVFKSRPVATSYPNSVVFDLQMPGIASDNIRIQQYWDPTKTISVRPDQTHATGIYYLPGYFRASLIVDEQVIKEHDLFLRTEGWIATISEESIPSYITNEITMGDNISVSDSVVQLISHRSEPTFLTYHYVDNLGIDADNFTLNTAFRNILSTGPSVCQTVRLFVLCSKGAIIVPISIPGCISDLNLMVSDYYLRGKENDLSAFGTEMQGWQRLKLEAQDKVLKIYLNDKEIHQAHYSEPLGEIAGFRFGFLGAGEIDYLEVKDKNSVSFTEHFNQTNLSNQ